MISMLKLIALGDRGFYRTNTTRSAAAVHEVHTTAEHVFGFIRPADELGRRYIDKFALPAAEYFPVWTSCSGWAGVQNASLGRVFIVRILGIFGTALVTCSPRWGRRL